MKTRLEATFTITPDCITAQPGTGTRFMLMVRAVLKDRLDTDVYSMSMRLSRPE